MDSELEDFLEPDYPSFPINFKKEDNYQSRSRTLQTESKIKDQSANEHNRTQKQTSQALLDLITLNHKTKYPEMFLHSFQERQLELQQFFTIYEPMNIKFISQMKESLQSIKILRLGSNKIYVGKVEKGKFTGNSIICFKNGNLYEGEMRENKRHGKGFYIHVNIGWYCGDFENDYKNGSGFQVQYGKCVYKGQFYNGLRHGKGIFANSNQEVYDGEWKLGIIHGKGYLKTSISKYTGNFMNNLKHGSGEQIFKNGDHYKGQYRNGNFDGIGMYLWKVGGKYEGGFKNGKRNGKGKWQGAQSKYQGSYVDGVKQGYGEVYFKSGNFYKGNFINDHREGYGEMFWSNSNFYKGEWKNGVENGKGEAHIQGSGIIYGIFENGILVQVIRSLYDKQKQISNLKVEDFSGKFRSRISSNKSRSGTKRAYSEEKNISLNKKLGKIAQIESTYQKTTKNKTIHGNMFATPHNNHSHHDGDGCKRCTRRLENFRLKQAKNVKRATIQINDRSLSKERENSFLN